ncbi:MAG TPA: hypothetical protein VFW40_10385 [Capsulimonadaceae bacterium]|nr:hypothetical protein [Capsulimonadaceae bacterium]
MDTGNDILQRQAIYWGEPQKATELKTASEILGRVKQQLYDAGAPTPTATILLRSEDTQAIVDPPA